MKQIIIDQQIQGYGENGRAYEPLIIMYPPNPELGPS